MRHLVIFQEVIVIRRLLLPEIQELVDEEYARSACRRIVYLVLIEIFAYLTLDALFGVQRGPLVFDAEFYYFVVVVAPRRYLSHYCIEHSLIEFLKH